MFVRMTADGKASSESWILCAVLHSRLPVFSYSILTSALNDGIR